MFYRTLLTIFGMLLILILVSACQSGTASNSTDIVMTWGGLGKDEVSGIAVDGDGNIFVGGSFSDVVDFNPGPGTDEQSCTRDASYYHESQTYMTDGFISKFDANRDHLWTVTMGSKYSNDILDVAVDSQGNIYAVGASAGLVDYDPGAGHYILESAGGSADAFVVKYSPDGQLVWANQWGGNMPDYARGIALSEDGDIYIAGQCKNSVDFDHTDGIELNDSITTPPTPYLLKLDSDRAFEWVLTWDITQSAQNQWEFGECRDVAIGPGGDIYIAGTYSGVIDLNPGSGSDKIAAGGKYDEGIFIVSIGEDRNYRWGYAWRGRGETGMNAKGPALGVDDTGDVYITAGFYGETDLDPGEGDAVCTPVNGVDVFLTGFTSGGQFRWTRTWGGRNDDFGMALDVGAGGEIVVAGDVAIGEVDFDPSADSELVRETQGFINAFVSVFDSEGNLTGTAAVGTESRVRARAVVTAGRDTVYLGGVFTGLTDFDVTESEAQRESADIDFDCYVLRLEPVPGIPSER